jgi:hypothetical protein
MLGRAVVGAPPDRASRPHGLTVACDPVPGTTIAVLAVLVTASLLAVGLAYRSGSPRAWNALGAFAVGGVICAYGLLSGLLGAGAPIVVGVGAALALAALVILTR